jgi:hypothetical protein
MRSLHRSLRVLKDKRNAPERGWRGGVRILAESKTAQPWLPSMYRIRILIPVCRFRKLLHNDSSLCPGLLEGIAQVFLAFSSL